MGILSILSGVILILSVFCIAPTLYYNKDKFDIETGVKSEQADTERPLQGDPMSSPDFDANSSL